MKNFLFLLAFAPTLLFGQTDTVYVFEGFDYGAYNGMFDLDGGSDQGWTGPWSRETGDDAIISRGNLVTDFFTGDEAGTHANLEFVRAGIRYNRRMRRQIDDGRELWVTAIMDWRPGSANENVGNLTLTRNDEQVISIGRKFSNQRIAIVLPGGINFETEVAAEGTHVLLLKIEMSGDATAELAYLWVDPDLDQLGPDPDVSTADAATPANTFRANSGIDGVQLKVEGTPPLLMGFDRLVIGGSVASIAPGFLVGTTSPSADNLTLRAFPNPVHDRLGVQFTLDQSVEVAAKLYDLNGRLVADLGNHTALAGDVRLTFNLGPLELPAGTYLLQVAGEGVLGTGKVVVW